MEIHFRHTQTVVLDICSVVKLCRISPQSMLEEKGLEALNLRVPFDEKSVLEKNINYLVRSLEVRYCYSRLLTYYVGMY